MNSLVPANFGPLSSRFANVPVEDDLASGVQSSFGMIGYKGKVWSVRFRGEEQMLMRPDEPTAPRNSIEVVIIKAATVISKVWYEDGYVEGSTAPPDCFSNNGVRPEAASTKPQNDLCATCARNQWGSRITPAGKQGKDCADSKRLAVVPLEDLLNEVYGGPMLLRVPAASLQDMAMYGTKMGQLGYPYFAIGTRISFDVNEAYPKFLFNAIRPLADDEADIVIGYADNHTVDRILSESEFSSGIAGPDASSGHHEPVFEQPVPAAKAKPAAGKPNGAAAANQTVGQQARAAAAAAGAGKAAPANKPKAAPKQETTQQTVAASPAQQAAAKALAAVKKESPAVAAAKAALAAAEAAAALAAAEAAAEEAATSQGNEDEVDETVDEDTGDENVASDFEASLDEMLSTILPK